MTKRIIYIIGIILIIYYGSAIVAQILTASAAEMTHRAQQAEANIIENQKWFKRNRTHKEECENLLVEWQKNVHDNEAEYATLQEYDFEFNWSTNRAFPKGQPR